MPRGSSDQRLADANSGLMPPRHAADEISPNNSSLSGSSAKQQAEEKLVAARKALQSGDIDLAEKLTQAANSLGVPESQYLPDEDRPSLLAWDISQAKQKEARQPQSVAAANPAARYERPSAQTAEIGTQSKDRYADITPTAYGDEAGNDRSSITPVPLPPVGRTSQTPLAAPSSAQPDDGPQMLAALPGKPVEKPAKPEVSSAAEEMPPPGNTSAATNPNASEAATKSLPSPNQSHKSFIDSADEAQQLLVRKIDSEVLKRQSEAVRLREKDSERSLAALHEAQQIVNDSKLPESQKHELLSRIDKTLHDTQEYIKAHGAQIELDKQNQAVLNSVDRDRELKVKLQQKIADQVNEYNSLNHEQRYAESEIVARRLHELAPDDPVVAQVWQESKFLRRERMNDELQDKREDSFWRQLNAVEESAVNPVADNGHEIQYDQKHWSDFVSKRKGSKDRVEHHSERELEIERRLQTPVLLRYDNTPLSEVMNSLSQLANVNIHLDPRGLSQEGVNSDTPVTINLSKEISLKSALNLILEPLHLSYVVSDEVLKITSEQLRDGELYTQTYNVADLVTPIPNFVPSSNIGLQGLINDSMAVAGRGPMGIGGATPAVLVNDRKQRLAKSPSNVLAQQLGSQPASSDGLTQPNVPVGSGPGGMGAAANADFDSLIDLITSTVATDTWAENGGGQAEIRPFPTNLSLVISQTQAVHEQIADLLQQLRRLQDLQVTIEVRFITLNDNFFERIGVDFDMNIVDKHIVGATPVPGGINNIPGQPANNIQSATVGVLQSGPGMLPTFTTDLDVPFRQGSFDASLPPFATFDPNTAATMGFAILSDIEAYFLIQAAQSDSRTNVLEAPKVTLFNGQQAFVADASQRPFVIGVIPVVGEFASAQQPVIVVLNEGTMMSIQAVVSDDRRYVRMTIVPFFSQIGNVDTFTFAGSSSSTSSSSSATDKTGNDTTSDKKDNSSSNNSTGVTVQLPTFSFVSVVTTVSVPDGGTVLLGGIKRLREGRNEVGVPLLSKVPYINRLFRNVGIGRQTESLMMMVTPRIIIQEEEEEKLGIAAPTP
ncbi:MAG TPA: hypothetical protein VHE81_13470 [Lacipirellulaceae bacterium]|nr:hypothetical protein [Lacipirellulaceae bacterium]